MALVFVVAAIFAVCDVYVASLVGAMLPDVVCAVPVVMHRSLRKVLLARPFARLAQRGGRDNP